MPDSLKNLKLQKYKYTIIYIYDKNYEVITKLVDKFFKDKYDLNKRYLKIDADKSKKILEELDVTVYPIILCYNKEELIMTVSCYIPNFIQNLEKVYNDLLI